MVVEFYSILFPSSIRGDVPMIKAFIAPVSDAIAALAPEDRGIERGAIVSGADSLRLATPTAASGELSHKSHSSHASHTSHASHHSSHR